MKILIGVDGSIYTDHALEFLASREGFLATSPEIEMLSVVPQIPAGALRFIERDTLEGYYKDCSEKIFKPIRKFLKGKNLPVNEVYTVGDPSEGVAAEAERTKPDLLVMGSRGRSSLKGLFLGSVTRGVLARTKLPMLIVRSDLIPKKDAMRVGIAVDGSPKSKAVVRYILDNRDFFGKDSKFYLIYVTSDISLTLLAGVSTGAPQPLKGTDLETIKEESYREATEDVIPMLEKAGVVYEKVCEEGAAGDVLAKIAKKKKLDLMVMGTHGYGRFKSAVLGSTAMRLLAKGSVPVLLVRK